MEEVDEIVIHTLRQIGCDIEDDILSLREFTTEIIVEGVVRCLKLITPTLEVSHHVPPSMSARYRLGTALAAACTELGYKGEIGYQTFLYSSETDLRKIFLFIIEKLPKESEKVLDEPLGKVALILRETTSYLAECLSTAWLPSYCREITTNYKLLTKNSLSSSKSFTSFPLYIPSHIQNEQQYDKSAYLLYYNKYMSVLSKQVSSQTCLISSIFEINSLNVVKQQNWENEWNENHLHSRVTRKELKSKKAETVKKLLADCLMQSFQQKEVAKFFDTKNLDQILSSTFKAEDRTHKGSRFVHSLNLQFTLDDKKLVELPGAPLVKEGTDTKEEKHKKREDEIIKLQAKVDALSSKLEHSDTEAKKYESSIQQITELINKEQEKSEVIKESFKVKKCTLSLLPDAQNNIEKIQSLIEGSSQRLISLAKQWEQHRVPLVDEYRELKDLCSQRLNETQRMSEEIKDLREKIRDTGNEARHKDEVHKQLISAYERLTKDVNRSAYTKRIMEIVGNIKKQKAGIDKVLLDTRNVQKEINKLSGKLERTFAVTDELIFKDARKDDAVRRAYKHLAALHENCNQLVQIVEETGSILREIRELEDQIEQENQKKVSATLERITSDYKQMQQENASLVIQLK